MRTSPFHRISTALSLAILLSIPCFADPNGTDSPEKLKDMVQSVYASKDKDALKMLYLPRGVMKQINATLEVVSWDFGQSIKSIEWKESDKLNQPAPSYIGQSGIVHFYCPAPGEGGTITVNFSNKSPVVFSYGKENGRYYLITTCS